MMGQNSPPPRSIDERFELFGRLAKAVVELAEIAPGATVPGKDVAKLIRCDLAQGFPGVRFSVRCSNFSMGSSIDIYWTDGPVQAAVEAVTGLYQSVGFDAMDDSSYSYWHWQLPDGRIVHGRYGARTRQSLTVSCHHQISPQHLAMVKAAWAVLADAERWALWRKLEMGRHGPAGQSYGLDAELSEIVDCWRDTAWHALARQIPGG